jgi:hypothetical protein
LFRILERLFESEALKATLRINQWIIRNLGRKLIIIASIDRSLSFKLNNHLIEARWLSKTLFTSVSVFN